MAMMIAGRSFGAPQARLLALPAIAIAGCTIWMMLPGPSDAEGDAAAEPSSVIYAQNVSLLEDAAAKTTLANPDQASTPAAVTAPLSLAPEARSPIEGLRISSQSWRRGGLGSKALVTFTLRNANEYPVKDIEIACAFTRRDGSHLTDRRRVIPDTVNTRSRKVYSGVLVGFVNVNANKAKCSLVTASRT
ncbi:hypothetical protein JQ609_04960 [Bradyrhizobium sp. AUGA SZCCT0169]|jgi:hypothetical protein|uniref:hypothetical protein n=1 Tax=unclassified Bradyrhizobium TaxID=2631580 RepID=UPI001BACEB4A|nr:MULTISPECIES: hypothetical protein [unclassified Bradyrhizobium]MBR1189976.1 hypothetical protein [Bradyrhizobium sp. AUGA SZCCT0160]MBR1197626.1 hypothetical protein [Bradyrhizobium sp. AUGA SZCCT0158]MBR1241795.1 hypothetical protein [Bradyrhizobium sp. AUGA SZCCT0274]MBR1246280.1 hypothetical protein [Bradyrhizobium sp. AUGA SZCCT0169]